MGTKAKWRSYYETLKLLPDEVVLDLATREFDMGDPHSCVCGWALKEDLLLATGSVGSLYLSVPEQLEKKYPTQTGLGWNDIFLDVCEATKLPLVERAFVEIVNEVVERMVWEDAVEG